MFIFIFFKFKFNKNMWYSPNFDLKIFGSAYYISSMSYFAHSSWTWFIFEHLNNFCCLYIHNVVYKYCWIMHNIVMRVAAWDILAQGPQLVNQDATWIEIGKETNLK